jgi:hypothetical protein
MIILQIHRKNLCWFLSMFDWNVHLPCRSDSLSQRWNDERTMTADELLHCLSRYIHAARTVVTNANFMIFNETLDYAQVSKFCLGLRELLPEAYVTMLVDLSPSCPSEHIHRLMESGVNAVTFHSYFQKITVDKYSSVLGLSKVAAGLNMPILIDASYGSTDMYIYNNLSLAGSILSEITDVPVVLMHSGGARAMEAFLLADACPNVFLDTSFSVPYYMDSTIEKDLAYAYKRIGVERVLFGSDFPYVSFENAVSKTRLFFERNGFSDPEIEIVFSNSPNKVFVQA